MCQRVTDQLSDHNISFSAKQTMSWEALYELYRAPLISYTCESTFTSAFILGFVNFDSGHWKQRKIDIAVLRVQMYMQRHDHTKSSIVGLYSVQGDTGHQNMT